MATKQNILIVVCLSLTFASKSLLLNIDTLPVVLDRLLCLLYSLFIDQDDEFDPQSMQSFFYFELPFWYLSVATIILFFEWSQIVMFLSLPTLQ